MNNLSQLSGIATVYFGPNDSLSREFMNMVMEPCNRFETPERKYKEPTNQVEENHSGTYIVRRIDIIRK